MIVLNLIAERHGVISYIKSFYCNVSSVKQLEKSNVDRAIQEYLDLIREVTELPEDEISDQGLLDEHWWDYSDTNSNHIHLVYSNVTEQLWPV